MPRKLEKTLGILTRAICHGTHSPFAPKQPIGRARDLAHVDTAEDNDIALVHGGKQDRHQRFHRRQMIAASSSTGGR